MKIHLHERLGVPENIVQSAERYYNDLIEEVGDNIRQSDRKEDYYFFIQPSKPYQIGDEQIKSVKTNFIVEPKDVDSVDYKQLSVKSYVEPAVGKTNSVKNISTLSSPNITLYMEVPRDYIPYDVVHYLVINKAELVASLSHEFKHIYDEHKKQYEKMSDRSSYVSSRAMMDFDIPIFEILGFYIYYTHLIEALVRPTETLAYLKQNKISKKNFINFLKKIVTYDNLKKINEFSMEEFREVLKNNYMNEIDNYLKRNTSNFRENLSDNKKIDLILTKWYQDLVIKDIEQYAHLITMNEFGLFSLPENKQKAFQRHIKKLTKFADNPLEYFSYIEKYLHKVSGESLKKIYRLYDLLDDEETPDYIMQKKISDKKR